MIDLEKMIEKEVEKQLINRGIASKAWVLNHLNSGHKADEIKSLQDRVCSLELQTRKLFAISDRAIKYNFPEIKPKSPIIKEIVQIRDLLNKLQH